MSTGISGSYTVFSASIRSSVSLSSSAWDKALFCGSSQLAAKASLSLIALSVLASILVTRRSSAP